ncbi:DUF429 domain-containing protein [Nocardioides insulae]|uniref:DUF429 domain-containing protein n=1 Tax=Nocardioides insulae TaxID=394734 RepID=UPI00040F1646|nr:DUF429 domain-containing protein [Nocardioides insulae]
MYFAGVDLAWGERRPTGLAVLDEHGRLVHVSAATTDEEIVAVLAPYLEEEGLVAIDAPLIVTNATGNRPAEALLNQDFARFDAGAHPTNTGRPEFRDKPRGARIAARLGLDLNPRSRRPRRAIEVYPHPATVALFRLGRTLKYKNKPGRDLEQLRAELVVLLGLLEGLSTAEPPLLLDADPGPPPGAQTWSGLRAVVEQAGRKSELRVVEDQVDAVLCAYIGLFATRRPDRTTTYGDVDSGYIITPTLPTDLTPTPRGGKKAATGGSDPGSAVRQYAELQPRLRRAVDQGIQLVTSILDDAGINYLAVTGRAKSVASFAAKAARSVDGHPVFTDPLREITDQVGIRVVTYVQDDVEAAADLLGDQVVVHDDRDMGLETASEGRFGYASRHLLVGLDATRADQAAYELLRDRPLQIQIRTVLQHAWAEFEHDIRYKGTIPDEHVPEFDRRFTLAAGLLELADHEFSAIWAQLRASVTDAGADDSVRGPVDDPRISARDLAAFLAGQYAESAWSRTVHYEWIATVVLELGITSLAELAGTLRTVDDDLLAERMAYRSPSGAVRRLDDALLWAYGDTYLGLRTNAHRVPALRARLARMRGEV